MKKNQESLGFKFMFGFNAEFVVGIACKVPRMDYSTVILEYRS